MKKMIGITGLFLMLVNACTHDAVIPDTPAISFASDISPLITSNCASSGCHDGTSHEFSLIGYDAIKRKVKAGNANGSSLYTRIAANGSGAMPPNNPLTDDQVRLVYVWIMQGAKNN
jgi:hypothetical protein